jgi:hypothetical protein
VTALTIQPRSLARMRATARRRLTARAQVLRATMVETETGTSIDWLPVSPVVPAGVRDPTIGAETLLADRITSGTVATVLLPLDDDLGNPITVRAQDRLAVTVTDPVDGTSTGVTLEVEGVQGRFSDFPILQRVPGRVIV